MKLVTRKSHVVLWTIQGVLAALFLFAGGMKLVMPIEMMKGPVELPGLFLRFIGVCEVLGAIGLILPEFLHIRRELTPVAAAGLTIIMIGAVGVTMAGGDAAPAIVPFVVGVLTALVANGRWRRLPAHRIARAAVLQPIAS
jgi:hypothetical protein